MSSNVTVWHRRDGTPIGIVDMTDDHLNASICMLDRAGLAHYDSLLKIRTYLRAGMALMSDDALDAASNEFDAMCNCLDAIGLDIVLVLKLLRNVPVYDALIVGRQDRIAAGSWNCKYPLHNEYTPYDPWSNYTGLEGLTNYGKGDSQ